MSELVTMTGTVMAIYYENPQNLYKVVLISITDMDSEYDKSEIVVTGTFGQIHEEVDYRFKGKLVSHPKYGQQFAATSYEQLQPTGEYGLIRYLSGEQFSGIGQKTAQRIVDKLGVNAIELIIEQEDALDGITGLSAQKKKEIREILTHSQGTEKAIIALTNYGFTPSVITKIINRYRSHALEIVQSNPYQLVRDIEQVGFKKIDALAQQLGLAPNDEERLKSALFYVIREICYQSGNTYLYKEMVIAHTQKILEQSWSYLVDEPELQDAILELVREGTVIVVEEKITLAVLFFAEQGIANAVSKRLKEPDINAQSVREVMELVEEVEEELAITYDSDQKRAIRMAVLSDMFILTGGPGTGKTTVISGIVSVYANYHDIDLKKLSSEENPAIVLAAPTGRAAKRMNETTGLPAMTIHRLLGLTGDENELEDSFANKEITAKLLIVDEMSMVDTWLMNQLMKAISQQTKVVFVGDQNQLPSVGPGQVLHDLLAADLIPQVELTQIFRQKQGSSIIHLAHDIKDGNVEEIDFKQAKVDRSFFECATSQIKTVIEKVVEKALAKGFTKRDIQVLAPMYKGDAGITVLNAMMQELLNPLDGKRKRQLEVYDQRFRVGDKVLQLVNRAESNVFNGDIGEITAIQYAKENEDKVDKIFVAFDQVGMEYPRSDFNQLTLAYCCSIHKAQGSEFKLVILPMVTQYGRMLRRNLLYTAITRSQQWLVMCGQERAFLEATYHVASNRQTFLGDFLVGEVDTLSISTEKSSIGDEEVVTMADTDFILTEELILHEDIPAMIGMEECSPYDFMK